ncbi:molecular chaperone, partial [Vibrio parahaemolyticus]|nr:molecular chaperone [Vibrio parahaemolyticus]
MTRWFTFFVLSFTCMFAHAFKVEPMSAEMAPLG